MNQSQHFFRFSSQTLRVQSHRSVRSDKSPYWIFACLHLVYIIQQKSLKNALRKPAQCENSWSYRRKCEVCDRKYRSEVWYCPFKCGHSNNYCLELEARHMCSTALLRTSAHWIWAKLSLFCSLVFSMANGLRRIFIAETATIGNFFSFSLFFILYKLCVSVNISTQ